MLLSTTHALTTNHNLKLPRILILEDDIAIAEILKEWFKMSGYKCLVKTNTSDIIELVTNYQPDLVIMDYLLPGINGGELCSQIKKDASTCHIPVIICSAFSKVLMSLGTYSCNVFIPKPFDLDQMIEKVEELLCCNGKNTIRHLTS